MAASCPCCIGPDQTLDPAALLLNSGGHEERIALGDKLV